MKSFYRCYQIEPMHFYGFIRQSQSLIVNDQFYSQSKTVSLLTEQTDLCNKNF